MEDACLIVRFDGFSEDVERQSADARAACSENRVTITGEEEINTAMRVVNNFTLGKPESIRITAPPSEIVDMIAWIGEEIPLIADPLAGIIDVIPNSRTNVERFIAIMSETFSRHASLHAYYRWRHEVSLLAGFLSAEEKEIARRLKFLFDPSNMLGTLGYYS